MDALEETKETKKPDQQQQQDQDWNQQFEKDAEVKPKDKLQIKGTITIEQISIL